ncbi:PDZ domain-containing protein [bacterium]|nr:PDZ domain-containing protein [bacterium]
METADSLFILTVSEDYSMKLLRILSLFSLVVCSSLVMAQTREEKVRGDREKVVSEGFWIYNNLPEAFKQAQATGKPIVVVLRCIPCEECVKLDDDLVDTDPVIRSLLEKFICVRQVSTNGLDLSLFQYDTDQSFAVFFLNADKTIYGRFGTRSHRTEWVQDVSLTGLAAALRKSLELHESYPSNKALFAGKKGGKPLFQTPEKFPSLKDKFTARLNYEGNVVKSCIHCHQIGDAVRDYYRVKLEPIPEDVLYPYPHPKVVGITLDPETAATIRGVESNSPAANAGLQEEDVILELKGQPILSSADVQWVLHNISPKGGRVSILVDRNGAEKDLTLQLTDGWREKGDLSWRVSSWGLRRMATGGLRMESISEEKREGLNIPANKTALLVSHVGQYNEHAAAKRAGVREGDIIISVDGKQDILSESAFLAYGVTEKKMGEKIKIEVLRNGTKKMFLIPMQK